jgi:uncharacterized protein YecA (UPF0149 family)
MQSNGDIVFVPDDEPAPKYAIPMTKRQVELIQGETPRVRKNWMKNQPCFCGSGKKVKHCCWSKIPSRLKRSEDD